MFTFAQAADNFAQVTHLAPRWGTFRALPKRTQPKIRFRLAPESIILSLICLADLATTLFWVSYRDAAEANPLMNFYLQTGGTRGFIAAKMVFMAMPLLIAEWARGYRPRFVRVALRVAIAAYLTCYVLGVAQINGGLDVAASAVGITLPELPINQGATDANIPDNPNDQITESM